MNIESLVSELPSNPILIIVAVIISLIPLLKFLKEIFIDFEVSRFRKIINTKDYESTLSPELRDSLIDARDRAVFSRIYGLNINKKYREIILNITSQQNINIDCEDISRSFFYINFEGDHMIINYRPWINFLRKFNITVGVVSAIIGFIPLFIFIFFYNYLTESNTSYLTLIMISYTFFAFDRFKQARFLRSVIRILSQADQLSQYIKVDEDWWFKKILRKFGYQPKSFAERDFNTWES